MSRIDVLAGETRVFPDFEFRLTMARKYKEDAVKYSKEGAEINLAFYEKDLADFLRDHRNVKRL